MVITCWSVKGGSGTTVIAAALALRLARVSPPVVLADLGGDLPAALGRPEPAGPGIADWIAAGPDVASGALERLAAPARPGRSLLPRGNPGAPPTSVEGERLAAALGQLNGAATVVDGGSTADDFTYALAAASDRSLLVIRPCFLALRHAVAAPIRPTTVVLVTEPQRTLSAADVEDVLGAPVVTVAWDHAVARAVDAGLLVSRVPRPLDRALRDAA
jgi:hypothetical protein